MPKFRVLTKEVWTVPVDVNANSKEEAIEIVADGGGEEQSDQKIYSYVLDTENWAVESIETN